MSRIGKKAISIPAGVEIAVSNDVVKVKGPKGELTTNISPEIKMTNKEGILEFVESTQTKDSNAKWGMTRAVIANMIMGVTEGFEKKLELVGVGYRATASGKGITLALGYSHPIEFEAPEGIKLAVEENRTITVSGIDKQLVGQTAAKIRAFRKPEVYKGKGVRYSDEQVRIKPGKAGKV